MRPGDRAGQARAAGHLAYDTRSPPARAISPSSMPPAHLPAGRRAARAQVDGEFAHLPLGRPSRRFERLAAAGLEDLAAPARLLARDIKTAGGVLDLATSAGTGRAAANPPHRAPRRHLRYAGRAHGRADLRPCPVADRRKVPRGAPGLAAYVAWAEALLAAYRERLATMGDADCARPACTTHLGAVDRAGTMVA